MDSDLSDLRYLYRYGEYVSANETGPLPSGKSIYIPKELQGMDLQNPASQWSYHRMAYTENFVIHQGIEGKDV